MFIFNPSCMIYTMKQWFTIYWTKTGLGWPKYIYCLRRPLETLPGRRPWIGSQTVLWWQTCPFLEIHSCPVAQPTRSRRLHEAHHNSNERNIIPKVNREIKGLKEGQNRIQHFIILIYAEFFFQTTGIFFP